MEPLIDLGATDAELMTAMGVGGLIVCALVFVIGLIRLTFWD